MNDMDYVLQIVIDEEMSVRRCDMCWQDRGKDIKTRTEHQCCENEENRDSTLKYQLSSDLDKLLAKWTVAEEKEEEIGRAHV